jgi:hypothetical protein
MYRFATPLPTAPGKTETDIKSIAEYFRDNLPQYKESRKRRGITMERIYLQPTPMGNVVIAYFESERSFGEGVQGLVNSDLEIDRRFLEMVAEIHGVDFRQPPPGDAPETIGEWADPQVTSRRKGLAFIAPALPGKKEAGAAFCREAFVERQGEFAESRRALGGNVEVVTFNSTPMGDFVCVYVEGNDPVEANRRFAASTRPFDVWFKDRLKELFPPEIDFSRPVPPVEQIWDYSAEAVTT